MKQLSLTETVWIEHKTIIPSKELEEIMQKFPDTLTEEELVKIKELHQQLRVEADPEDAAAAQEIYDKYKIEGSQLIVVGVELPSGRGIINCRVGSEHKQIRF